jgi:hypothetical protein
MRPGKASQRKVTGEPINELLYKVRVTFWAKMIVKCTGWLESCKKVLTATQKAKIRRNVVQSQLGQIVRQTLSGKYPTQKRAGGEAGTYLARVKP